MFVKIVIVLLLLIVAASLLTGRNLPGRPAQPAAPSRLRPLMLRVAIALLVLGVAIAALHFLG